MLSCVGIDRVQILGPPIHKSINGETMAGVFFVKVASLLTKLSIGIKDQLTMRSVLVNVHIGPLGIPMLVGV